MEFLDNVDDNDNVVGSYPIEEIYAKKLSHRIVHVLVFNNKKELLLQLRSRNDDYLPLHWVSSTAGHVRSGESYEEAALREMNEELKINTKINFAFKDSITEYGIKKFIATFIAEYDGNIGFDRTEVEDVKFFSMEEIKDMIKREKFHPQLLLILKNHFNLRNERLKFTGPNFLRFANSKT